VSLEINDIVVALLPKANFVW